MVGTYRTHTGTESETVIVLQENGVLIYTSYSNSYGMSRYNGTWTVENNILYINYEYSLSYDGDIRMEQVKKECTIVPGGIMLGSYFYEKVK